MVRNSESESAPKIGEDERLTNPNGIQFASPVSVAKL
jgi:hypothetical protein